MPSRALLTVALAYCLSFQAHAADLAIGLAFDITTMDPHFANISSNVTVHGQVFDQLITHDNQRRLQPRLATAWKNLDDLTWEFKLRQGVKFQDGSEFTAEDVVWSLDRPATLSNSPSPFTVYTRALPKK